MNNLIPLIKALAKPDQAMVTEAVNDWLDDHPEATTTVEDGSITKAKLDNNLQGIVDEVGALKSQSDAMTAATKADEGLALKAKKVTNGKVTEWEFGEAGGGLTATVANLLLEILEEGVYGSDQEANIELLRKALMNIKPVSISAVLTSTPLVGLYYQDLEFTVTATFDDASTMVVDNYRVLTEGPVTSGSNTVTVDYKGVSTTVTFTASTVQTYGITQTLTNVNSTNNAYLIVAGERFETTLGAGEGYYISSVSVTMGGVDITSTAYNNGSIVIDEVTGNVVITVTASEYVNLDDLIVNRLDWSVIHDYSDDGTTLVKTFNYNGRTATSEYPAMSDCTIEWEIKNVSESSASVSDAGFGTIDCVTDNYLSANDTIDISYFVSANNLSGTLAPGSSISGELIVKAGHLIVFQAHKNDFDKFEIKMRGTFVKNTFSGYTKYDFNNLSDTYGGYRTVSFYSDNGTTLIESKASQYFKKIADQLDPGTYDVYYKKAVNPAVFSTVWSSYRGIVLFGAVSANTDTASNYAGGSAIQPNGNLWHHSQITVTSSGMTFIGYLDYITDMDGENINGILMLKKVVTE